MPSNKETAARVKSEQSYIDYLSDRGLKKFCQKYGIDPEQPLDGPTVTNVLCSIDASDILGLQGRPSFDMEDVQNFMEAWFDSLQDDAINSEKKKVTAGRMLGYYCALIASMKSTAADPEINAYKDKVTLRFGAKFLQRERSVLKFMDRIGVIRKIDCSQATEAA